MGLAELDLVREGEGVLGVVEDEMTASGNEVAPLMEVV